MNMIKSLCNWCSNVILVNQKEWTNSDAHMCHSCLNYRSILVQTTTNPNSDKEFETTDEELEQINPELGEVYFNDLASLNGPSCSCGAHKIGSPWHSTWCDLYEDPMQSKKRGN